MKRRKKKGRNDATEGRRISTRGGEREKMQENVKNAGGGGGGTNNG